MYNYNIFHRKNVNTQNKFIDTNNYTYQTIISIFNDLTKNNKEIKSVLDLGCGVGTIDFYIANKGFLVKGVDISSKAIDLAIKSKLSLNANNVNFECSDLDKYQDSKKYDLLIISEVIEHVHKPDKLMVMVNKLLKDSGYLIVSTPLDSAPLFRWGLLEQFDKNVGHLRRFSEIKLSKLINKSGFLIIDKRLVEGLLRNYLFTINRFGFLLKFVKWPLTLVINFIDNILLKVFGPANVYLVCRKK